MSSRRNLLRGVVGLWSTALIGSGLHQKTEAARRGHSGPALSGSNSSGGYTVEIRSNRKQAVFWVILAGRGPTDYSVNVVNQTTFELRLDVFLANQLIQVVDVAKKAPFLIEHRDDGLYRYFLIQDGIAIAGPLEVRIPNPS